MKIEHYTIEELYNEIIRIGCRSGPFIFQQLQPEPKVIAVWNKSSEEINHWFDETIFIGSVWKRYPCQAEFECEEDFVAFKLRWL